MVIQIDRLNNIRDYVIREYPDSCLAQNDIPEDYADIVHALGEFFMYEIFGFCGCGSPGITIKAIRDYLRIVAYRCSDIDHGTFEGSRAMMKERFGVEYESDNELLQFMAYTIDNAGMTEHGSSISGCWIEEFGSMCMDVFTAVLELDYEDNEEVKNQDGQKRV